MATKVQELTFAPRFKTAAAAGRHFTKNLDKRLLLTVDVQIYEYKPELMPDHANAFLAVAGVKVLDIQIDEIEKR